MSLRRDMIESWLESLDEYGTGDGKWIPTAASFRFVCELALKGLTPRPEELPLMTEYRRRAQEVSAAAERSLFMEREFVLKKVLNKDANEALADHHAKRAAFGAWLLEHHWSLLAPYMNSGGT